MSTSMAGCGARARRLAARAAGRVAALVLGAAALAGCGTSLWERSFVRGESAAAPRAAEAPVRLREVPWSRVSETLAELEREVASSDVHPDEWPTEKRAAAKATLLRGLQVSDDPAQVEILGRSRFRTTSGVRPEDAELSRFARSLGATTVVWSSTHLGKAETIVDRPVTEHRWSHGRGYRDADGRWRDSIFSDTSTAWVPVVVEADERGWMAFYLRERGRE